LTQKITDPQKLCETILLFILGIFAQPREKVVSSFKVLLGRNRYNQYVYAETGAALILS